MAASQVDVGGGQPWGATLLMQGGAHIVDGHGGCWVAASSSHWWWSRSVVVSMGSGVTLSTGRVVAASLMHGLMSSMQVVDVSGCRVVAASWHWGG